MGSEKRRSEDASCTVGTEKPLDDDDAVPGSLALDLTDEEAAAIKIQQAARKRNERRRSEDASCTVGPEAADIVDGSEADEQDRAAEEAAAIKIQKAARQR